MGDVEAILSDAAGFMKSRIVLTAAELDIFTVLSKKPLPAKRLSAVLGIDLRAATRLLDCLITFGLVKKQRGCYFTTKRGSLLSGHHPKTVLPMVLHMNTIWENWGHLTESVKKGMNPSLKPITNSTHEKDRMAFIGAMHVIGKRLSKKIANAYNLKPFTCLLDIGGASGTYTVAFLKKNPKMRAVLFDLKAVIPMARARIAAAGMLKRVELVAGDFYKDELPRGCDLVLLSAIIHQNSPEENLALYRKIYRAIEPWGTLLIRDYIMDNSRTKPPEGARFALNMLVNTPGGDTYTFSEVKDALQKAGFKDITLLRRGKAMDCLVEGKRPV